MTGEPRPVPERSEPGPAGERTGPAAAEPVEQPEPAGPSELPDPENAPGAAPTGPPPPSQPPVAVGPPPGWYHDPTAGDGYRWWSGTSWTEQRTDSPPPAVGQPTPSSPLAPAGAWLRHVLQVVLGRTGHLFTLVVVVLLPFGMLNGMVGWYALRNAVIRFDDEAMTFSNDGVGPPSYLAFAGTYLLLVVAALLLVVATARHVLAAEEERPELWSFSLLDAVRRLPPAVGVAAATLSLVGGLLVVTTVVGAIVPPLLPVTLLSWLAMSAWIGVRLGFGPVAAALAPAGTSSLRTSWSLTRSSFWAVTGRLALLLVAGAVLSLLAANLSSLFTAIAGAADVPPVDPSNEEIPFELFLDPNPVVHAISVLFGTLGQGAALVVWAAGLGLLYRDLGGPVEATDEAELAV